MFTSACCRCGPRWLGFGFGARGSFPDPKKDEDYNEEEVSHLLDNVTESDDEEEQQQAHALRSDEIKRYLDRSGSVWSTPEKANGRAGSPSEGKQSAYVERRSREIQPVPPQFVDEYDELFDEEFEDEPAENVVVGARSIASQGSVTGPVGAGAGAGAGAGGPSPGEALDLSWHPGDLLGPMELSSAGIVDFLDDGDSAEPGRQPIYIQALASRGTIGQAPLSPHGINGQARLGPHGVVQGT